MRLSNRATPKRHSSSVMSGSASALAGAAVLPFTAGVAKCAAPNNAGPAISLREGRSVNPRHLSRTGAPGHLSCGAGLSDGLAATSSTLSLGTHASNRHVQNQHIVTFSPGSSVQIRGFAASLTSALWLLASDDGWVRLPRPPACSCPRLPAPHGFVLFPHERASSGSEPSRLQVDVGPV
jgi:hypothetical protein